MSVKKNIMEMAVKRIRAWWVPVVIGLLELGASALIFFNPWETFVGLSMVFAIFFIVDGVSDMLNALFTRKFVEGWGWYLISGLFTMIMGVAILINPTLAEITLTLIVSMVVMSGGVIKIGMAISESQDKIRGWGWNFLGGLIQMILGIYLVLFPALTPQLLVYFIVAAFASIGLFRVILGLRLRSIKKMMTSDLEERLHSIEDKLDQLLSQKAVEVVKEKPVEVAEVKETKEEKVSEKPEKKKFDFSFGRDKEKEVKEKVEDVVEEAKSDEANPFTEWSSESLSEDAFDKKDSDKEL